MQYLQIAPSEYAEVADGSALLAAIMSVPAAQRMTLYPATDAGVVAYLTAQAEAAKPKEVTMRQARLALLQADLLDSVVAAIASMPNPQKQAAEIEWEYSNSLKRSQPLTVQLGAALGLDAAALDALFLTASTL